VTYLFSEKIYFEVICSSLKLKKYILTDGFFKNFSVLLATCCFFGQINGFAKQFFALFSFRVLGMCKLVKCLAIAICLQWSLPASAEPETCVVSDKLASLLIPNTSLATELTTTALSYFTVRCSCTVAGETLVNNSGKVKLSIIQDSSSKVYNGLAGIRLSASSGNFESETMEENYQVNTLAAVVEYEQSYSYFVKVSAPDGELLQAKPEDYAVAVRISLSSPPTCQAESMTGD
jgi:hypothetical protein